MTDEDTYAERLGKKFERIRGRLCAVDADDGESARAVARYVYRELRRRLKKFPNAIEDAVRLVRAPRTLFTANEVQQRLERACTENLGAQHLAHALARTIESGGGLSTFTRFLAEYGIDATKAKLSTQKQYQADGECRERFGTVYDASVAEYATLLERQYGDGPKESREIKSDPTTRLLSFPVARSTP